LLGVTSLNFTSYGGALASVSENRAWQSSLWGQIKIFITRVPGKWYMSCEPSLPVHRHICPVLRDIQ
jgi:hypothetical protein